jgi:hypothetical protein
MKTIKLAGSITVNKDGSGALNIRFSAGTLTETPPTEPPDELPPGTVVIEPSGGDDTELLRNAVEAIPEGGALALKGMFRVSDTIRTSGGRGRTVCGYPGVRSGILVESPDMPGFYGAMLQFDGAIRSTIRGLEIDGQGHSTQPIEVNGGEDNTIEGCYIHDIGYTDSNDPTLAAIHSEGGTRLTVRQNRIERTGGNPSVDSGIRGIWLGKGQIDALVEDNVVSDTGHTCIAVEPCSGVIRRNTARNSLTQGTLFKIALHPQAAYAGKVEFYENTGENSRNGGLMLEAAAYESIDVHHNTFLNCGAQGTSFGALYTSQWTTTNARIHDNVIENCRSQGAMNRSENCVIENNRISGENTLWLESDDKNITVSNSGRVSLGNNCSNIWVDGQQVA